MKNKTVYISGPITGIDFYKDDFHRASKKLAAAGYIPIDPCSLPHEHELSYEAYMREDLKALLDCDYIYMLPGWKDSMGADCEHGVAVLCGIEVLELD